MGTHSRDYHLPNEVSFPLYPLPHHLFSSVFITHDQQLQGSSSIGQAMRTAYCGTSMMKKKFLIRKNYTDAITVNGPAIG
jgi:hypothetical protein